MIRGASKRYNEEVFLERPFKFAIVGGGLAEEKKGQIFEFAVIPPEKLIVIITSK